METVKITTKKGRIITLDVYNKTDSSLRGIDKYGEQVIVPYDDILSLYPVRK